MTRMSQRRKLEQTPAFEGRAKFWSYCVATAAGSAVRAKKAGVPHAIDKYFIDQLLVDQDWKCAISGITLSPPGGVGGRRREPFAPSLDRIIPMCGCVPGNVRIVCNMVNFAMNEWGEQAFMDLIAAVSKPH